MKFLQAELLNGATVWINLDQVVFIGPVLDNGVPMLNACSIVTKYGAMTIKMSLDSVMEEIGVTAKYA